MTPVQIQFRARQLLQNYVATLEDLAGVLQDENLALLDRNFSALELNTGRKEELLRLLADLDRDRDQMLSDTAVDPAQIRNNEPFAQLNRKILATAGACREQNEINGAIIEISSLFNQRLLELMLGKSGQERLYDAKGKDQNGHGQTVAISC